MGYAGYAPGTVQVTELSDAQKATRALPVATLETLLKVCGNTARNPQEAKFRRVKLSNEKVRALITDVPGAVAVLQAMGWTVEEEEGESYAVLPQGTNVTQKHVRDIQDALDHAVKKAKDDARAAAARKKPVSAEKAAMMAQLEADRKERATQAPVTSDSKNQWHGGGANITRAADVGIGCSSGG